MSGKRIMIFCVLLAVLCVYPSKGEAMIVINEILADPAAGLSGDANQDGVTDFRDDEFIEFLNMGAQALDISAWTVKDSVSTRHVFPQGTTLAPYQFLVVFGGGSPQLPGVAWQGASSGQLALNNTGDAVSLWDSHLQLIATITYGSEGGQDQSLTRFPDGTGASFLLHSQVPEANGALFSSGKTVAGEDFGTPTSAVPEPLTLWTMLAGAGLILRRRHPSRVC